MKKRFVQGGAETTTELTDFVGFVYEGEKYIIACIGNKKFQPIYSRVDWWWSISSDYTGSVQKVVEGIQKVEKVSEIYCFESSQELLSWFSDKEGV